MAQRHEHPLFDTLDHAVVPEQAATLVTADERHLRQARGEGSIARLSEFAVVA
jgi:hypothetical protein